MKTVDELTRELNVLGYSKVHLCMDLGYCSKDNINGLYRKHYKFLCGASLTLSDAKAVIDELGDHIRDYRNYNDSYKVYASGKMISWDYSQDRPYKRDTITGDIGECIYTSTIIRKRR